MDIGCTPCCMRRLAAFATQHPAMPVLFSSAATQFVTLYSWANAQVLHACSVPPDRRRTAVPRFLPSDTTLGFEGWSGRSTRVRCVAYLLVVWLRAAPLSSTKCKLPELGGRCVARLLIAIAASVVRATSLCHVTASSPPLDPHPETMLRAAYSEGRGVRDAAQVPRPARAASYRSHGGPGTARTADQRVAYRPALRTAAALRTRPPSRPTSSPVMHAHHADA
jgi:hypothetical protein